LQCDFRGNEKENSRFTAFRKQPESVRSKMNGGFADKKSIKEHAADAALGR